MAKTERESEQLATMRCLPSPRLFLSAYTLYQPGLLRAAATKARAHGTMVMLDLASWEMLRAYAEELQGVLQDGLISCCIGNEVCNDRVLLRHAGDSRAAALRHNVPASSARPQPSSYLEVAPTRHQRKLCVLYGCFAGRGKGAARQARQLEP